MPNICQQFLKPLGSYIRVFTVFTIKLLTGHTFEQKIKNPAIENNNISEIFFFSRSKLVSVLNVYR